MLEPDDAPNEPDEPNPEPDPEASLPDPENDLPSIPEGPKAPSPMPESEVPGDLLKEFWATVLLANVAIFGLAAGLMALAFGEDQRLAMGLLAVGVVGALFGYRRYRQADAAQKALRE